MSVGVGLPEVVSLERNNHAHKSDDDPQSEAMPQRLVYHIK